MDRLTRKMGGPASDRPVSGEYGDALRGPIPRQGEEVVYPQAAKTSGSLAGKLRVGISQLATSHRVLAPHSGLNSQQNGHTRRRVEKQPCPMGSRVSVLMSWWKYHL